MPASSVSPTDLAYAAGIIDGEGCIRIIHRKTGKQGWSMNVEVCTTDPRLMMWLKDHFEGAIRRSPRFGNRKDAYAWKLSIRKAALFLQAIRPFLLIKGEQADLAIAFSRIIQLKQKGVDYRLSAEKNAERQAIYDRVKVLNFRGRAS